MMTRSREEELIQAGVINWRNVEMLVDNRVRWLHAVPNGGHRYIRTAAALKRSGVTAGVWDLHLPVPCKGVISDDWHSLWIEVKRPASQGKRKGVLTPEQKAFGEFVRSHGNATFVGYSVLSIIHAITAYLHGEFIHGVRY